MFGIKLLQMIRVEAFFLSKRPSTVYFHVFITPLFFFYVKKLLF